MPNNRTLVITTGGTIDAIYSPEEGTPNYVPLPARPEDTCIGRAIAWMGLSGNVDIVPLTMKDSKQLTMHDMNAIVEYVERYQYKKVVVVMGTDAMPQEGRYLDKALFQRGMKGSVTMVITGAMSPLRDKNGIWRNASDGWNNLRRALIDVEQARPGVYIEMGEGLWNPYKIMKSRTVIKDDLRRDVVTDSRFEPIPGAEGDPDVPQIRSNNKSGPGGGVRALSSQAMTLVINGNQITARLQDGMRVPQLDYRGSANALMERVPVPDARNPGQSLRVTPGRPIQVEAMLDGKPVLVEIISPRRVGDAMLPQLEIYQPKTSMQTIWESMGWAPRLVRASVSVLGKLAGALNIFDAYNYGEGYAQTQYLMNNALYPWDNMRPPLIQPEYMKPKMEQLRRMIQGASSSESLRDIRNFILTNDIKSEWLSDDFNNLLWSFDRIQASIGNEVYGHTRNISRFAEDVQRSLNSGSIRSYADLTAIKQQIDTLAMTMNDQQLQRMAYVGDRVDSRQGGYGGYGQPQEGPLLREFKQTQNRLRDLSNRFGRALNGTPMAEVTSPTPAMADVSYMPSVPDVAAIAPQILRQALAAFAAATLSSDTQINPAITAQQSNPKLPPGIFA